MARAMLLLVAALGGCGDDGLILTVDLRTDYAFSRDFDFVEVEHGDTRPSADGRWPGAARREAASLFDADLLTGARVAEYPDLSPGTTFLRVRLRRSDGEVVAHRFTSVRTRGNTSVLVVVARSCEGLSCVPDGACQRGRCVDEGCSEEQPELCGEPECDEDADCPGLAACSVGVCIDGECFVAERDGACGAGELCDADLGCLVEGRPADAGIGFCATAECDDGIPCTVDTCDEAMARCAFTPDHTACDDGLACTTDACEVELGCVNAPDDGACDDGVECTTDACDPTLGCVSAPDDDACDDGIACTDDACVAELGCVSTPDDTACDDGLDCTDDACGPSGCEATPFDVRCDDGNPCTDDLCDTVGGCLHANHALPCDDGLFCNGADRCRDGTCSDHVDPPCAAFCSETTRTCEECREDADCGLPSMTPFGACGGFADACDTTGTRSRTITTPVCAAGGCEATVRMDTEPCSRASREHAVCGASLFERCCGGACVDTRVSTSHCGGCGLRCGSGFACGARDGVPSCRCSGPHADCAGSTGSCSAMSLLCSCDPAFGGSCPPAMSCRALPLGADVCVY